MTGMTDEERAEVAHMLAKLHGDGYVDLEVYVDVEACLALRVGSRVRHRNQRSPQAYEHGTGVVLAITHKPDSAWSQSWRMPDVELIVLRDRAQFGSRLSQLAHYHVAVPEPLRTAGGGR